MVQKRNEAMCHTAKASALGLLVSAIIVLSPCMQAYAGWLWGKDILVTIDGKGYTTEDFKRWWENWREKGMDLPKSPRPFVDWILLAREAKRMHLDGDPSYKRKVFTFLKARSLMLLKRDEIDSKIHISEDDMWRRYEKLYSPRWLVDIIYYRDNKRALDAFKKLKSGKVTVAALKSLKSGDGGPNYFQEKWLRPVSADTLLKKRLKGMKIGQLSPPIPWGKGFVVLKLQDIKDADKKDYKSVRAHIRNELIKERQAELTIKLVQRLRKKYHVKVATERIKALKLDEPDEKFSNRPVITTDRGIITEKEFMKQVRRLQRFRKQYGFKDQDKFDFKRRVLNGIIAQTLTSWEALDRHYEDRPPLKATYRFYCQHRLIKDLEDRLFVPKVKVDDAQVKAYYEQHIKDFTRPGVVKFVIIDGSKEQMDKMWSEVAAGKDFMALARGYKGHELPVRSIPFNHLQPEVKRVISRLAKGEVSPPVNIKGRIAMIKLIDRKPPVAIPLKDVRNTIANMLRQDEIAAARSKFLNQLRAKSVIKINEGVWQKLRKGMERADEKIKR